MDGFLPAYFFPLLKQLYGNIRKLLFIKGKPPAMEFGRFKPQRRTGRFLPAAPSRQKHRYGTVCTSDNPNGRRTARSLFSGISCLGRSPSFASVSAYRSESRSGSSTYCIKAKQRGISRFSIPGKCLSSSRWGSMHTACKVWVCPHGSVKTALAPGALKSKTGPGIAVFSLLSSSSRLRSSFCRTPGTGKRQR